MLRVKLSDLLCKGFQNTMTLARPRRCVGIRSGIPILAYCSAVNTQLCRCLPLTVAPFVEFSNPADLKIMYHVILPGCTIKTPL